MYIFLFVLSFYAFIIGLSYSVGGNFHKTLKYLKQLK